MERALKHVRNWYLEEHIIEHSEEDKALQKALCEAGDALRALLNEEQTDALQKYENSQNEMSALLRSEAFAKGVRFATAYLLDAMDRKGDR